MEQAKIEFIEGGTVTSAKGFFAGAVAAGIKRNKEALDLGILYSETPCVAAGVFTKTRISAAAVRVCRERLKDGKASAIVVNAGCANAYTGEKGMADALRMAQLAAEGIGVEVEDVLVASTGVTGQPLPMDKIKDGISRVVLDSEGGHVLARAIMTTDTVPKEAAVSVKAGDVEFTIGGCAKGSGMVHPDMATMFCFLTTDAAVEHSFLQSALKDVMDVSLNMITVDGDTSPSDTVVLMANGQAGNPPISEDSPLAAIFRQALEKAAVFFARALARDGEGANRLLTIEVGGAENDVQARRAARTIAGSSLVKTAIYGGDPNWGRLVAALSNSGVQVDENKIDMIIGETAVLKNGSPLDFDEEDVIRAMQQDEVPVKIQLNLGTGKGTAWGCDMSEAYVRINSEYMT